MADVLRKETEDETKTPNGTEQPDIGLMMSQMTGPSGERRNIYIVKRNIIHQLIDVALLMANVSQLKTMLEIDVHDKYFYPLILFISLSITLQLVFTVCMLIAWSSEKPPNDINVQPVQGQDDTDSTDNVRKTRIARLDRAGDILVLMIIVLNILITGFGVEPHN